MTDIQQSSSPISSGDQSSHFRSKFIQAVAVILLIIGGYFLITNFRNGPKLTNVEQQAVTETQIEAETYTPDEYVGYLSNIDKEINSKKLSIDVKNMLLYRKALVMMDSFEPNEAVQERHRIEIGNTLKDIYSNSTDSEYGKQTKDAAVLAYLLQFNQSFFLNGNTRLLPDQYKAQYMELYEATSTRTVYSTEFQKLAFQTYIKFINDSADNSLQKDKTFVSNRMYLVAAYLDGFYSKIPQDERKALLDMLQKDINAYPDTTNIFFSDPRHTKLVADFYYAYASDIYLKRTKPSDAAEQAKQVQANYEAARKNVSDTGELVQTDFTMGQYIDAFYLSFLQSMKVDGYQDKITEIIKEMDSYAKDKQTTAAVSNFYNYFLSSRGNWISVRKNLLALSKNNNDFGSYLKSVNATLR